MGRRMVSTVRLLYLITRAEHGGGQVHLLDLLRGFRDRYDLALGIGEEGYLAGAARDLGLPVFVLPHLVHPIRPLEDARAVRDVYALIRRLRPALVHAHTSKAGLIGRVAARAAGVPAVFTAHTWAFAEGISRQRQAVGVAGEWLASGISERIINVSEANRRLALRYHVAPASKLVVVHNGVPDVPDRAQPGGTDEPRIVMVARFSTQKDHALLLHALSDIDRPFHLLLVGDGPLRGAVEREARRLGLTERVEFLGARDDIAAILATASIFVLASRWEGFPLSILEAMRAGLPVVASSVGGVEEAVDDGVTGWLVPVSDRAALRRRLVPLIEQPEPRIRMGEAGRQRYAREFTLEQMLFRTGAVYAEALGHIPRPAGAAGTRA